MKIGTKSWDCCKLCSLPLVHHTCDNNAEKTSKTISKLMYLFTLMCHCFILKHLWKQYVIWQGKKSSYLENQSQNHQHDVQDSGHDQVKWYFGLGSAGWGDIMVSEFRLVEINVDGTNTNAGQADQNGYDSNQRDSAAFLLIFVHHAMHFFTTETKINNFSGGGQTCYCGE